MGVAKGSTEIADVKLGTTQVDKIYLGSNVVWQKTTPGPVNALKFSSTGVQTIGVDSTTIGTLTPNFEYSTNGTNWTSWDISTTLSFGNGTDLYVRGSNTYLAIAGTNYVHFIFSTASPVECTGNIMHLFDYTQDLTAFPDESSTSRGIKYMFQNCTQLITPPSLPALTLVSNVYFYTFDGCTSLNAIPALPATVMKGACYASMFQNCSLIKMSETQTGEYQNTYTFGTIPGSYANNMFSWTGGTFTGNPTQSTYYTANTIIS